MHAKVVTARPRKMVPAFPQDATELLAKLFTAARALNPRVNGLTHVTPTHAVMQASGDPKYYLVSITPEQAKALGYLEL